MPITTYWRQWRESSASRPITRQYAMSTAPPISTRVVTVSTGPSTGASTRMKMNDAPQIADRATSRATSDWRTRCRSVRRRARERGDRADAGRGGGDRGVLQREQRPLAGKAAGVSGQRAVRADDAMAGNDDRQRIAARRGARRADARRSARARRELAIGDRRAVAHAGDRLPDIALERRADRRQRHVERDALAREIFGELGCGATQHGQARLALPGGTDLRLMPLPVEPRAGQVRRRRSPAPSRPAGTARDRNRQWSS